jgi:ABC-type phosphate transport system substrate-binding protein
MLRTAIVAILLLAQTLSAAGEQLRVCVSDILAATAFPLVTAAAPGMEAEALNSMEALRRIRSGEADLAIIATPDGTGLPEDLHCAPFAYEVTIIVVNNSNPLKETTLDALANALSASGGSTWKVFGIDGMRGENHFVLHLPDSNSSMTQQILRSHSFRQGSFKENAVILSANDDPELAMREQADCLMALRGLQVPQSGHALQIASSSETAFAYPPTESSVFYGDYPLRLPFYIVTRKNAPSPVADLEEALLSDSAAQTLAEAGYVPVPKSERNSN